jgi:hypothetical protein
MVGVMMRVDQSIAGAAARQVLRCRKEGLRVGRRRKRVDRHPVVRTEDARAIADRGAWHAWPASLRVRVNVRRKPEDCQVASVMLNLRFGCLDRPGSLDKRLPGG